MPRRHLVAVVAVMLTVAAAALPAAGQWVTRDHRWPPRGPWRRALERELPLLFREFNGIDFGHAHLAETLLSSQEPAAVERARLEVLDFIWSAPAVPPDEEQIAPTFARLVWEAQRTFDWAHTLHRSVYDIFASDRVGDKDAAVRRVLADYLAKPEAITSHRLDHHGKLWSFAESRSFREQFPRFNSQIWAYHWLQAAAYDVQLAGEAARQRELMPRVIAWYHGYLREPPLGWEFMPMVAEGAPEFSRRFPELAAIFDNLHMAHDNIDDILSRPDLYPTLAARREAILRVLPIYLHRNHAPADRHAEYHAAAPGTMGAAGAMPGGPGGMHGGQGGAMGHGATMPGGRPGSPGPRPPSAQEVLEGRASRTDSLPAAPGGHGQHGR